MRKPVRIIIGLLLIGIAGGVAWQRLHPPEPVYGGESLSHWLKAAAVAAFPYHFKDSPEQRKADEAIRSAGTNAIPVLLQMIRAHDSGLTRRFHAIARGQGFVKVPMTDASCLNSEGERGFIILGPEAKDAVPALIRIFEEHISDSSQDSTILALGRIGPASKAAIPSFIRSANDKKDAVRFYAVCGLKLIKAEPDEVVPVLLSALKDPYNLVRMNAAEVLEKYGTNAEAAVPTLVIYLNNENAEVRSLATNALKAIDPVAAAKAGVK